MIGSASIGSYEIASRGGYSSVFSGTAISNINLFVTKFRGYSGEQSGIPVDPSLNEGCYTMTIKNIPTASINSSELTAEIDYLLEAEHVCQLHQP